MKVLMSRTSILSAMIGALLLVSCAPAPIDQAVYDDFMTNFLYPEEWDEELEDRREDRVEEKLAYLRQVMVRVDDERMVYARRCNALDPRDSACQSVDDLLKVLTAINEVEMGLRDGQTVKGTLGQYMSYDMDDARRKARKEIAERVKKHFFLPKPEAN
jgi:hypothetical protein